ncbi:MAG TPA: lasso peptide biosynthesis B2 protein, partial [Gemmatimonadales bacterium]|nr:lasso peptide biosynthesis B2 protein [Gemmatimonadales bacterium]
MLKASRTAEWQGPSLLTCAGMILALRLFLRACGYGRVIRWVEGRVRPIPATDALDLHAVRAAAHTVATAAALYPGRARCLEQSLVLYYLLRRRGVALRYRQGVMPHPFQAHAWIEYRGDVITDVAEHAAQFARL